MGCNNLEGKRDSSLAVESHYTLSTSINYRTATATVLRVLLTTVELGACCWKEGAATLFVVKETYLQAIS